VAVPGVATIKTTSGVLGSGAGVTASTSEGWESAINAGAMPKPFLSGGSGGGTTPEPKGSVTDRPYFSEIANVFKTTPVLSAFYSAGESYKSTNPNEVSKLQELTRTTPILESVYKGGNVFELKSDYENMATSKGKELEPMLSDYNSKLDAYNSNVASYSKQLDEYNKSPTQSVFENLQSQKASLDTSKSNLDMLKSGIDSQMIDVKSSEQRYQQAASDITGNVNQSELITYGIGSAIGELGKAYESGIVSPTRSITTPLGIVGQVITGVISVPSQVATIGQSTLIGGETIIRSSENLPGLATAGLAMQGKGMYELGTTRPGELIGSLVGMYVLGSVVSAVGGKTIGLVRTRGQEYVPIENIGYTSEGRYPLNPIQSESALMRSFSEGKLYPTPKTMAEGGAVPYLHGEGGVPLARLPNAASGETTLWTALESSSRARGISVGEAYRLSTSGGSEVTGLYGAPIAESYFAKVGGAIPQMVGFKLPGTPTIYSTITQGLEALPKTIRESLPRDASGKITAGGWETVNRYVQTRSAEVPSGQGYMPMIKAEYEAIIPDNTIIEVTGRNYYTKLGGFGESHFLGTRVPIVEQTAIGFEPGQISTTPTKNLGGSYKPTPVINLMYPAPSATSASIVSVQSQMGISSASSSKTNPVSTARSISNPIETVGYQSRSNSYADQLSGGFGSSGNSLKSSGSPRSYSDALSYKTSEPSWVSDAPTSSPYSSAASSIRSPVSPSSTTPPSSSIVYDITSPIPPPTTLPQYSTMPPSYTPPPTYTPPPSYKPPITPQYPVIPPIPIPPLSPFGGDGGGILPREKKGGRRKFVDQFLYGQGIAGRMFGYVSPIRFKK
jgi:hypothetical protein